MSEEIVRRLMSSKNRLSESLKTSLREEDDIDKEEEESEDIPEEDTEVKEETPDGTEFPSRPPMRSKPSASEEKEEEGPTERDEEVPEESPDPEPQEKETPKNKNNINPLDNQYAVQYKIGDEVSLIYANGTATDMKGTVEGYDKEGFYRVRWEGGLTTNGITDIALSDMLKSKNEDKCVCGSNEFVNEGKYIVCDHCGRQIRESADPLMLSDKSRPKGKRMIRSEAHPISTAIKPSISEAIKSALKKPIRESEDIEDSPFSPLLTLEGEFWTRLPELVSDVEELGYEVLESNSEYIIVASNEDDDSELQIPIGGTSRTMTLDISKAKMYNN